MRSSWRSFGFFALFGPSSPSLHNGDEIVGHSHALLPAEAEGNEVEDDEDEDAPKSITLLLGAILESNEYEEVLA